MKTTTRRRFLQYTAGAGAISFACPPEKRPDKTDPMPAYLDWELWVGVAPKRPSGTCLRVPACRGEGATTTPFSYAGPLTEAVLLGTIASSFKDEKLRWDSKAMKFLNSDAATTLVTRKYAPDREIKNL